MNTSKQLGIIPMFNTPLEIVYDDTADLENSLAQVIEDQHEFHFNETSVDYDTPVEEDDQAW